MSSVEVRLNTISDEEKFHWIKTEVVINKKPPILLIRTAMLHWIAVGGYDDQKRIFYVYDPSKGPDSLNPYLPVGNTVIDYDDLLRVWRGRWFWKYVAIVVIEVRKKDSVEDVVNRILQNYILGRFYTGNSVKKPLNLESDRNLQD